MSRTKLPFKVQRTWGTTQNALFVSYRHVPEGHCDISRALFQVISSHGDVEVDGIVPVGVAFIDRRDFHATFTSRKLRKKICDGYENVLRFHHTHQLQEEEDQQNIHCCFKTKNLQTKHLYKLCADKKNSVTDYFLTIQKDTIMGHKFKKILIIIICASI